MNGTPPPFPTLRLVGVPPGCGRELQAVVCQSYSAETDCDCGRWVGAARPKADPKRFPLLCSSSSLTVTLLIAFSVVQFRQALIFVGFCFVTLFLSSYSFVFSFQTALTFWTCCKGSAFQFIQELMKLQCYGFLSYTYLSETIDKATEFKISFKALKS